MGDKNMKALAKQRANKDMEGVRIDYGRQPKVKTMDGYKDVRLYEAAKDADHRVTDNQRSGDPQKSLARDRFEDDMDDHQTKNKKVKQMRKFSMLNSLLAEMDELDKNNNGIPDSEE